MPLDTFSDVYIRTVVKKELAAVVDEIFNGLRWQEVVPYRGRVVLKPNLCDYRRDRVEAANTSSAVIEAVCKVLSSRAAKILIVESDGLRYRAEDVFSLMRLQVLEKRHGVELVNLTSCKTTAVAEPLLEGFEMPAVLFESDCLISLPKLKTHALTYFSGALKNQWGCIPRPDRILLHKHLSRLLPRLHQLLKPRLALMDGLIGMEGRGPTNGIARPLSLMMGARDLVALDATAMRTARLDPKKARHVVLAAAMGLGSFEEEKIRVYSDLASTIAPFAPAKNEWTLKLMNYLSRYRPFVNHILLDDALFAGAKRLVTCLRRWGVA